MSKKILLTTLIALALFSSASCSKGDTSTSAVTTGAATTTVAATTTAEETTEAVTTAAKPKDKFDYIDFFAEKDDGGQDAHSISDVAGTTLGVKFTCAGYWMDISLSCPSWNDSVGTMTFAVYKWDTDFDTTVAAEPVYTTQFVDYSDNETLFVEFEGDGLPADTYLWLIKDGTGGVGIWGKKQSDDPEIVTYLNGKPATTFGPVASVTIKMPAE